MGSVTTRAAGADPPALGMYQTVTTSIAPSPSEAVAVHIRALLQLTLQIDAALRGGYLPATSRARMAFGSLDLAVATARAIAGTRGNASTVGCMG